MAEDSVSDNTHLIRLDDNESILLGFIQVCSHLVKTDVMSGWEFGQRATHCYVQWSFMGERSVLGMGNTIEAAFRRALVLTSEEHVLKFNETARMIRERELGGNHGTDSGE